MNETVQKSAAIAVLTMLTPAHFGPHTWSEKTSERTVMEAPDLIGVSESAPSALMEAVVSRFSLATRATTTSSQEFPFAVVLESGIDDRLSYLDESLAPPLSRVTASNPLSVNFTKVEGKAITERFLWEFEE